MQAQLEIKLQMARQFLQSGRADQAETLFKQVLTLDPGNTNAGSALAMLYTRQQKHESAIEILDQTLKENPNNSEILIQIATVYKNWGKFDEAKTCYRQAISIDAARTPHVLQLLATTCRFSEYDSDVHMMEEAYKKSGVNSAARQSLAFALGKVFDDLKSYDEAFGYFEEGNRIVVTGSANPMQAVEKIFESIEDTMGSEYFRKYKDVGIADSTPIFVTGLPRSGTTLVEQILASHPVVYGGGELESLGSLVTGVSHSLNHPFPVGFDTLNPEVIQKMANQYVNELRVLARDMLYTTDKNTSNYIFIGLIKMMLPNAKIILCRRDPRDIGLSIFQQDLGHTYPWSYRLDWIGKFYGFFNNLMDHWERCLPGKIYTVQYEDLIADPENHIRALLKRCDLEFDPACLAFHATDRAVTTASRDQVRKPIYKGSVNRWKNYEQHLGPLISALTPESGSSSGAAA